MQSKEKAVKIDRLYIIAGFVWLIFGMVFGIYLGITDQLQLSNSHAHANLLGFVISVLFGLIYRNWPSLKESRLAMTQFVIYQIGAVVLVAGKYDIDNGGDGTLAPPGSLILILGTLLMFWMFIRTETDKQVARSGSRS
jgi:cbb3-type cytochrome oxidase subunit 1